MTAPTSLPPAFYLPTGDDTFTSTPATASPWDLTQQHGGPPAALLARAIDRTTDDPAFTIARLTVEMLGPIPQGDLRTEATVVRPGRRVELVEARLFAEDRLAVTASAWRIRETPGSTAHLADPPSGLPPVPPEEPTAWFAGVDEGWGYGRAIDWRFVEGGYTVLGPARLWARLRIPLVDGEETAPLHRLLVVADSANGLSARLPLAEWWSIPPTLTVTVVRPPSEEWMWMDAATDLGPDGRGLAHATMADTHGLCARIAQPLMVAPR